MNGAPAPAAAAAGHPAALCVLRPVRTTVREILAQLQLLAGHEDYIPLHGASLSFGRAVQLCDGVRIPAVWTSFSSTHCSLRASPASDGTHSVWMVCDHSTNGTYVNDRKLDKGAWTRLAVGDVLRLSNPPPVGQACDTPSCLE